jgi:Base plate wedge protein 53
MYFSLTPDIQYDEKPVKFPFSQSDYVVAKNFFRRFKIDEDRFSYSVFFKRYAIQDGDRLDLIAEKTYGTALYDWVIILTNNMINPYFDLPISESQIRNLVENPDAIHHYETLEVKNSEGVVVLKEGIIVDQRFVARPFVYLDKSTPSLIYTSRVGNLITKLVTNLDQAILENEAKREIYLLKPNYIAQFVNTFKAQNFYSKSTNYVDSQLKKSGV